MNYIVCVSVIQELTVSEFAECLRSLGVRYKDVRPSTSERERERATATATATAREIVESEIERDC
jgi:hypothetical protein